MTGYITCPCDRYEPDPDGICLDDDCGHDAHQHNFGIGDHEACLAQEGDPAGSYLPHEEDAIARRLAHRASLAAEKETP